MPAWLVSWIASIAISIIRDYGIPALIVALKGLEVKYPGITPLLEDVISFLKSLNKLGADAKPSLALEAAIKAHKECGGVACQSDLVK